MSETIDQTIARLTAFIKSQAPNVDISPGSVFNELVLNLESKVQNQLFSDINTISNAQSIQTALNSLGDTYSPIIDAIASNYNVYRNQGTKSTGVIKVYVNSSSSVTVLANTKFTQRTLGYVYTAPNTVIANIDGSSNAQKLQTENGLYCFTVPVVAQDVGQLTAISNGTQFAVTSGIANFVSAQAYGSFIAGLDTETDKQLIARFRNGLGINTLLSQNSITNQLDTKYANFQDVYLADSTSLINSRSLSNPLGIKIPGCVDVWVKDGVTIPYTTFTASSTDYNSGKWTVAVPSTAAPGFYRIVSVQDGNGNYYTFTTTYDFDTPTPNLINSAADARFSVYQNATLEVVAAYQNTPPSSITFTITALAAPDLASMQELFLDESYRIPCADYLVRGIVPCMVSMAVSLVLHNPGDVVDTVTLQSDIFNYINSLGFGEPVAVSQIVKLCHKHNIKRVDLPIVLNGTILTPSVTDTNIVISGTDYLAIPSIPSKGVIPENTMFFISYFNDKGAENININVN